MGIFKYFDTLDKFNTKKVSTGPTNEAYKIGDGMTIVGDPEVLWKDICFIEDKQAIWNHGQFYSNLNAINTELNNISLTVAQAIEEAVENYDNAYTWFNNVVNSNNTALNNAYTYYNNSVNQTYAYFVNMELICAQAITEMDSRIDDLQTQINNINN